MKTKGNFKLGVLSVIFVLLGSALSVVALSEGKKTKEINDSEIEKIKEELEIEEVSTYTQKNVIYSPEPILFTDYELKNALNQEMNPQVEGLTYGVYVLNVLYELNLIDSLLTQRYNIKTSRFFAQISEVNIWGEEAKLFSENALVGIIKAGGGSGSGVSTILMSPKLCEIGIGVKVLDDLFYRKALWYYLTLRIQGDIHNEAWNIAKGYLPAHKRTNKKLSPVIEKYFESLWDNWEEYIKDERINQWEKEKIQKELKDVVVLAVEEYQNKPEFEPSEEITKKDINEILDSISTLVNKFFKGIKFLFHSL